MQIAAIMPCKGRPAQTVENVRRLLATAGYDYWRLVCVVDDDPEVYDLLLQQRATHAGPGYLFANVIGPSDTGWQRHGYWQALELGTLARPDATYLINLANDLWACDDWLKHAVEDYRSAFGDGPGLLGFAGDGWGYQHSCHFLVSRALLDRYGGWPTWYSHNFGDRELCARAQQDGVYAKSERAYLEHCHPLRGQAPDDAVYQAGRATYHQDEVLFVERRRQGWPKV